MWHFWKHGYSPIGVDLDTRSIKLVQLTADGRTLTEAVRSDRASDSETEDTDAVEQTAQRLRKALSKGHFHGRNAVFCIPTAELVTQNVRVPDGDLAGLRSLVADECARRLGLTPETMELRYLDVGTVRQGESVRREVILLGAHSESPERLAQIATAAGLELCGIDAEPMALLRCRLRQFRREEDQLEPKMFVTIGYRITQMMIVRDQQPSFLKSVPVGGKELDAAVCQSLQLRPEAAHALRRNYGDRRKSHRDPEVMRSVQQAVGPLLERLAAEIGMAVRYFSVTFRGEPPTRVIVGGSEADDLIRDFLQQRIHATVELSDPVRAFELRSRVPQPLEWETAIGLALFGVGENPCSSKHGVFTETLQGATP